MKPSNCAFILILSLLGTPKAWTASPNIVLIIADDLSWDDVGCYGNPHVRTPNIDELAGRGMLFEQAFLTITSCSPSRASLITGLYPHNTDAEELHWPLPGEKKTFVESLKQAGYWTGAAGKWHLGDAIRNRFDAILDVDTSGFQLPSGDKAGQFKETTDGDSKSGCADWVKLLRSRDKDKPFFAWLAALDPHRPYEPGINAESHDPENVRVAPYHPNNDEVRGDYVLYYDEIHRLDRFVGDVVSELALQGVAENTIVIFISDNGRPFPRDKTTLYDSGMKTPMLVVWPNVVKPNSRSAQVVSTVDLAPTILDAADTDLIPTFAGKSLVGLLKGGTTPVREFAFAEKNWHDFEDHARAVRSQRYKYIRNYYDDLPLTPPADAVRSPTYQSMLRLRSTNQLTAQQKTCFQKPRPAEELYDTAADPHEMNNLASDAAHADALASHRTALAKWEAETGDHVAKLRTADEFDRVTGKPTAARRRPRWSKQRMVSEGLVAP